MKRIAATAFGPNFRLPLIALGAVLAWFGFAEIATQAWYAVQESRHPQTPSWPVLWPDEKDAMVRGFADFRERPLTDAEKEILRYDKGHAASWKSGVGNQWTGFYFEWKPDYLLNQLDLVHNPTVCLPAAGLTLVKSLPNTMMTIGPAQVDVHGWEFESGGQRVFVFVATRWLRDFPPFSYVQGLWLMRLGNLWRAAVGNRGNALQTLELVGVGFSSASDATKAAGDQLGQLSSSTIGR